MQKRAFVLILFTTVILGAISYPTVMFANSCSNVTIHGSFDESRINDNNYTEYQRREHFASKEKRMKANSHYSI
jgi:hypothetical protein